MRPPSTGPSARLSGRAGGRPGCTPGAVLSPASHKLFREMGNRHGPYRGSVPSGARAPAGNVIEEEGKEVRAVSGLLLQE